MQTTPYHCGEHVASDGLTDASGACPGCGSTAPREPVFQIQRDPDVALLRCGQCGLCSASHMPTAEVLRAYYGRYYDPDGPKQTFAGLERFARHLEGAMDASGATTALRVMDFGGGDGGIAARAAERWCNARQQASASLLVVDYAAPEEQSRGPVQLRGVPELSDVPGDARFDAIIASAILEHVPDVGAVMGALWSHLAPGGTLYARTPYWEPLLKLLPNTDLTFPGHVHDMGAPFWSRVVTTMSWEGELVWSRPSIVETELRTEPARTLVARILKAPAHLEARVRPPTEAPWWRWVGGWEVCVRRLA